MGRLILIIVGALFFLGGQGLLPLPAEAEEGLKVSIRGQIRFNTIYADQIFDDDQTISPGDIHFDSGPAADPTRGDHDQTTIDARRSRLWLDITDTFRDIKLAGKVQVDFNTGDGDAKTSNSRHLRLRLAYGQATMPGGWTLRVGQARTILSEFSDNLIGGVASPSVVNENGHFDQLQSREPGVQLAWTGKIGDGALTVGAAVEKQALDVKSSTGLSAGVAADEGEGQDIPLFGAGVRYRSPFFAVFARGAGAQAKVIRSGGGEDEEDVWLGAIGAEVKPMPMLKVYGQYWLSDGLNRISGTFDDVSFVSGSDPRGELKTVETQNFHVGAQLKLTKALAFNAVYQWQEADDDREIFDLTATSSDKETIQAFNVNAIYKFWKRWDTGLEYMYGKVDSFGDSDGDINVVNWRMRFYF